MLLLSQQIGIVLQCCVLFLTCVYGSSQYFKVFEKKEVIFKVILCIMHIYLVMFTNHFYDVLGTMLTSGYGHRLSLWEEQANNKTDH